MSLLADASASDTPKVVGPIGAAACISSIASLAHALQSKRVIPLRQAFGAVLNTAANTVIAYLLLEYHFPTVAGANPMFRIGVAASAGLGNAALLDFFVTAITARRAAAPPKE